MVYAPENVIQTHDLSKSFGTVQALKGLNLCVPKNSITGFLGPNGAGKSTAIKLLLGLSRPTRGSGTIFGLDIRKDSSEIRRRVGYLSQQPRFYDAMSAREVLRFTLRFFFRGPHQAIEDRVQEMLEMVGLEHQAERPIRGFSGGERQRLGIAQAQVNYPDLLILDEPAAALDPMGRHDVLKIMERLRKYTTIFYSTHILDDVQRVSDRVVILNRGEMIAQGPIEELLAGNGACVYRLSLEGSLDAVRQTVQNLPWVVSEQLNRVNGRTLWNIAVSDETKARNELLRVVLADPKVTVLEFGQQRHNLEDIFIQMVQGEIQNGS